jgi:hypothetical protein
VQHLHGGAWNGKVTMYLVPSGDGTAIYVGDPVKSGGTAGAAGVTVNGIDVEGMATIAVAAAGDTLRGVVVGFLPVQTNLETLHRVASTNRIALVCDQPDVIFEVQEDSVGNDVAATQVGNNFDIAYTAGSTVTGRSKVMLDSSDASGTSTAQLRLLGYVKKPGNVIGSYAKLLVVINEHELKSTTGV